MKRLLFLVTFFASFNANALKVTATIKPIQSIVQYIAGDKIDVNLILHKNDSPHQHNLKPSEVKLINESDLVFYINPAFETFMEKISQEKRKSKKMINLSQGSGIVLMAGRESKVEFDNDDHDHDHHDHHDDHDHLIDYHIWLNLNHAIKIAQLVSATLSEHDKQNTHIYAANFVAFRDQAKKLDKKLQAQMMPFKHMKYLVLHDAYQYFDKEYGPEFEGAIILPNEISPGAAKLAKFAETISSKKVSCVFQEPQLTSKYLSMLNKENKVKLGTLDGEWGEFNENSPVKEHYFLLMESLAKNFINCFESSRPE